VVLLVAVEQLTYEEVSKRSTSRFGTVMSRLSRRASAWAVARRPDRGAA